jgi:hypothetical protein
MLESSSSAAIEEKIMVNIGSKIGKQLAKRGWTQEAVEQTVRSPHRTLPAPDTRYLPDGSGRRRNDPATAYINADGSYVIRNDVTGDIVQVSDRNKPNWKAPWAK